MNNQKVRKLLFNYTSDFNLTTARTVGLTGIYHSEGKAIASNEHVLFVVQFTYDPSIEGRIFNKGGTEVLEPYPDYTKVIPDIELLRECTDPAIMNSLHRAAYNLRHAKLGYHQVCLCIDNMCFHPRYILDVLQMFKLLEEPFKLFLKPGLPAVFKSPSCTALVMPLANCEELNKFAITDAASFGDLL